ncbi:MAG TPA: M56 family metallopeptidase [Candidatus Gemmiger avium]|nr:M56 family metallopeptidase [Candidatus Gemmiger avium]
MELFVSILNMSIASSVLFLLVLLLRRLLRGLGSAGFLYLLWLPLLFRMLVPYSLPSPASLFNLFGKSLSTPGGVLLSVTYFDPQQPVLQSVAGGEHLVTKELLGFAAGLWAAVAVIQAAWVLARYFLLRKKLARGRSADLTAMESLFARATGGKRVPVIYTTAVAAPLVFGFLHPKIALPVKMQGQTEGTEYILLHELTHVRRRDYMVLQLFTAAAILHWFNPLAWLARRLMIQDMEAACDERVLGLLNSDRRVEYAQTLLNWADTRRHSLQYANFGRSAAKQRILRALNWQQLPPWAEMVLAVVVCGVFTCALTNPVLADGHYLPVSSPFVREQQREMFRSAARQLVTALETGDAAQLAQLASMDPAYYEPVYAPFGGVHLRVEDARLYCNSNHSAEVYLTVEVLEGGGVYSEGEGVLVARLSQTGYRDEPFVTCLMPQKKYEDIRLLEDTNEAVRLAVRLAGSLDGGGEDKSFTAGGLSPVTVAKVCMQSAIADKGETSPFTRERMAQLANEYFAIDGFFCDDPAVYDAAADCYYLSELEREACYPVEFAQAENGHTTVTVESYRDPMSVFPETKLECQLTKVA